MFKLIDSAGYDIRTYPTERAAREAAQIKADYRKERIKLLPVNAPYWASGEEFFPHMKDES